MHTTFERSERQTPSSWQTMVSWCVVIGFIALVADWQSIHRAYKQRQEEIAKSFVSPGSPEGHIVQKRIEAIIAEAGTEAKAKTLSPFKAAQLQIELSTLCAKLDMNWNSRTEAIYHFARQCYVDNWVVPAAAPPDFRELLAGNPVYRTHWIEREFDDAFILARDGAQLSTGSPDWSQLLRFFFWLFKWYYLLTIPSVLIVIINLIWARKSVREEIIIGYQYWLRASCFGPIGILCNSETGSRTRRYNKLRGQFMTEHNQKWPTRDEEDALWLQTLEPVLRFDQALEQIKQSEQRIRRPLLVVVLSSLMCVRWSTMTHHRVIAPHVISATADTTPPGPPKLVPDDGVGDFDFVQDGNWMVPVVETEYRHEPWCCQSVMLAAYRPRGPPVPTCQGANPDLCPFSLVLPEEIVT